MEYKVESTLNDFNAWGQAVKVKEEILRAGKGDSFEAYISELYTDDLPTDVDINDLLSYEWESLYEYLGMSVDEEEYDECEDCSNTSEDSNIQEISEWIEYEGDEFEELKGDYIRERYNTSRKLCEECWESLKSEFEQ